MVFYKILNYEAKKRTYKMYTIIQCSLPVINIFVFPPSGGGGGRVQKLYYEKIMNSHVMKTLEHN